MNQPAAPFKGKNITEADFVSALESEMSRIDQFTNELVAAIQGKVDILEADVSNFVSKDGNDEDERAQLKKRAVCVSLPVRKYPDRSAGTEWVGRRIPTTGEVCEYEFHGLSQDPEET